MLLSTNQQHGRHAEGRVVGYSLGVLSAGRGHRGTREQAARQARDIPPPAAHLCYDVRARLLLPHGHGHTEPQHDGARAARRHLAASTAEVTATAAKVKKTRSAAPAAPAAAPEEEEEKEEEEGEEGEFDD